MKKYICLYLLIISTGSFAQVQRNITKQKTDSTTTEPAPARKTESRKEIYKELNLTREQKIKMRDINQTMKTSKEAIENDTTLSETEKKEKLKSLRKEQATKIQAILTEEQKIKFRQMRMERADG